MAKLKREKGLTTIDFGNIVFVTNKINRFRYNNLRKKIESQDFFSPKDCIKFINKK